MKRTQHTRLAAMLLAAALALTACKGGSQPQPTPEPTPTGPDLTVFEGEKPDTKTDPWCKNTEGWYVNESGYRLRNALLRGLDVSKWQGEIDWEKVRDSGFDFAILRCGSGAEWDGAGNYTQDDEMWRANADGCTKAGLPFGCYIYSYADTEEKARSEADHVARLLGIVKAPFEGLEDYTAHPYTLDYPVYLDLEAPVIAKLFPDEMARVAEAFTTRLRELGYKGEIGIYASRNWYEGHLSHEYFDEFEENMWVAQYADQCTYQGGYTMWQSSYTVDGTPYGVPANIDVDFTVETVELEDYEVALNVGETFALGGRSLPAGQAITYTSADETVAAVAEDGRVTGVAEGTTVISAQSEDGLAGAECVVHVGTVQTTLLFTGNIRGDVNGGAGIAKIAALRAQSENALLLDCGNSTQGNAFAALTAGQSVAGLMKSAGYGAQAVGRYDLAYGRDKLLATVTCMGGPSLAANLLGGDGPLLYRSTYNNNNFTGNGATVLLEAGGKKIGVFGLTCADADNTVTGKNLSYVNYGDTAVVALEDLYAQGADAVVMLCDLDSISLRQALDGIPDEKLPLLTGVASSGLAEESRGYARGEVTVPVVYAAEGFGSVGRLTVTFAAAGGVKAKADLLDDTNLNSLTLTEKGKEKSEAMEKAVQSYAETYNEDREEVFVWTTPQGADGTGDTALGDLAADAYAAVAAKELPEEAVGYVTALTRGGSVNISGQMTAGDALDNLAGGDTVQLTTATGAGLYTLLEAAAAEGTALQCSGFSYTVDFEAEAGSRISGVTLADKTKVGNDEKTTVYLAADSSLVAQLPDSRVMLDLGDAYWLAESVILSYTNAGEVIPTPDGRIAAK